MIIKLDKESRDIQKIESLIGKQLDLSQKLEAHKYGSNLYILRDLSFYDSEIKETPSVNSRCNFEIFEKGMLLRINDRQKLYALALSDEITEELILTRGVERAFPLSLTRLLIWIGLKKESIMKNRLLSSGYYHERFRLEIKTKYENLILDSNDSNYFKEKAYFGESMLKHKLTIVERAIPKSGD